MSCKIGVMMLFAYVDEFTPCLKDTRSGELVQTEVVRVVRESFLQKYNESSGWYATGQSYYGIARCMPLC